LILTYFYPCLAFTSPFVYFTRYSPKDHLFFYLSFTLTCTSNRIALELRPTIFVLKKTTILITRLETTLA